VNEITVYDMNGNFLTELAQWDEDVFVCIKEEDITQPCAVHFFNSESDMSYVVNSIYEDGVLKAKIPHDLLSKPYSIIGYIYITDIGGNRSVCRFRLNMRKKPMPSNFIYKGTKDYVNIEEVAKECREYSDISKNCADTSKSYAVGGTGTRNGENNDNAKYYSQQSNAYADISSDKATESSDSAKAAKASESNAKISESNSKTSETNSKASETAAKNSEINAAASKTAAANSAQSAKTSETNSKTSETNSKASETAAKSAEANALSSKNAAAVSEENASSSAETAITKAAESENSAKQSKSYSVGSTGIRENENIDNAKYYYEQSKSLAERLSGTLCPMGTVAFADLPLLESASQGDMYNISNQFTTNSNFKEGAGNVIPAGANVYKTADGKWDILAGTPVTGVKGNSESTYRRGNINITPDNIGALTNIKIGTVTTGNAGSNASATASTSGTVTTLNLTIPKGDTGAKGDKGDTGSQGAAGAKGATGTRGSRWNTGTAITGTSTTATVFSGSGITDALANDMYLNTSTGYTYRCTTAGAASTAKWVYAGSIKGAKGDTGAAGTKGDTGAKGAKGDKGDLGIYYGTCSTAADTVAKTVALSGFTLATGAMVAVRFTVTNTAANTTLNVNGTGAKAIRYRNAAIGSWCLAANRTYTFVYDGTYWQLVGDVDTNTTYTNMTAATASAAGKAGLVPAPAAGNQAYVLRGDGKWHSNYGLTRVVSASFSSSGFSNSIISPASYFQVVIACTKKEQQDISFCYTTPLLPINNSSKLHLSTSNMPVVPYCMDGSSYKTANFITVAFQDGKVTVSGGYYGQNLKENLPLTNYTSVTGTIHLYWYY